MTTDKLTSAEAALVRSAVGKLSRGESLSGAEARAHAKATRIQEAATRAKLFGAIAAKDFAELCGCKPKQLEVLTKITGLSFNEKSISLFDLLPKLIEFLGKCSPPATVVSTGDRPKIVPHAGEAVAQLAEAGITVSTRTLRAWLNEKGCPGKTDQGYDVAIIEAWAIANSDKTVGDANERSKRLSVIQERIKEEELRDKTFRANERQRKEQSALGNILPLDVCSESVTDILATLRSNLMGLPKKVAGIIGDQTLQRTLIMEGESIVAKALGAAAKALEDLSQAAAKADAN